MLTLSGDVRGQEIHATHRLQRILRLLIIFVWKHALRYFGYAYCCVRLSGPERIQCKEVVLDFQLQIL